MFVPCLTDVKQQESVFPSASGWKTNLYLQGKWGEDGVSFLKTDSKQILMVTCKVWHKVLKTIVATNYYRNAVSL